MIFTLKIRNYFFTGIIVLVPIGFTLYLSKFLMNASSNLLPSKINPNSYLPINIPGIEIIITIFFITFIGFLSLSFLGKKFLQLIDTLFKKIPLLGTFWSAVKQMSQSFKDNKHKKKSVVLVEYPRKGVWAVGFATKENEGEIKNKTNKELINVFVPTTPNPTSGFLLMFEKNDIIYLDMSFEEASKFVVSAGTTSP
ncbi:MAG: DUF502 domain-containing protein [Flavobacteriaceae bacterium]|nr:DUF502 domain-containing protein [Flavobacteriaceae bacterium]